MTVDRNGARSMGRVRTAVVGLVLALAAAGCSTSGPDTSSASRSPQAADAGAKAALGKVPLSFVENRGQVDGPVDYYVQGADTSLYFGPGGVTYSLTKSTQPKASAHSPALSSAAAADMQRWAVKLDFVGANPVAPTGVDLAQGVVSYFSASAEKSHTAIPTYSSIAYRDLWPGIDMVYSGTGSQLKYDFVVHPGADPSRIRLAYRGADKVALNDKGQINVTTPAGGFTDDKPFTYQDIGGKRVEVTSSYTLEPGAEAGNATVAIPVGDYDTTKDLVIDPAVFVYAGFLGGSDVEEAIGVAVDETRNAYVTGMTKSPDFPVMAGFDGTNDRPVIPSGFVAKVDGSGALVYASYIDESPGSGIAVDSTGSANVTGSAGPYFPRTSGPEWARGETPFYTAKINPAGTALVYATMMIGGVKIAVDEAGQAYVAGVTQNPAAFPAVVGPRTTSSSTDEAFVAKLSADGTTLLYAGFLAPGIWMDALQSPGGIAVDIHGAAYIAASGFGNPGDVLVPGVPGPGVHGTDVTGFAGSDAAIFKVVPDGTGFAYAGYIGGDNRDFSGGIAVDSAGNAYITGMTQSTPGSLPPPASREVARNNRMGGRNQPNIDAFVFKLDPTGTSIAYAAYPGGQFSEEGFGIKVDETGAAYVTGRTTSGGDSDFNNQNGPDSTFNGNLDGFVAKLNPSGTGFDYAGFIGGAGVDWPRSLALDGENNVYIVGTTTSTEASFAVLGGPDLTYNGGGDAFIVKISETGG